MIETVSFRGGKGRNKVICSHRFRSGRGVDAGLVMEDAVLLIFGNPKVGTLLC